MLKKSILLASLLGSLTIPVYANQLERTLTDSLPAYRWNVGVDLLNLFRSGQTNVLLWKQVATNRAWRLSVGADFTRYGFDIPGNIIVTHSYSILVRPGYEWRFPSKRHMLYQGVDCGIGYSGITQNANKQPLAPVKGQVGTTTYSISSSYFAGFRHQVFDRCSVWAEAAFQVSFSQTNYREPDPQLPKVAEPNQFNLNLIPLRHIGVSYHF